MPCTRFLILSALAALCSASLLAQNSAPQIRSAGSGAINYGRTLEGDSVVPAITGAPALERARKVVERGISFLQADAIKWRKERGCATCHHGTMTVWALSEAKEQGFPVDEPELAKFIAWAKSGRVPASDQPQDPRPGWRLVSQPAIYLSIMSHNLPILSRDEIHRVSVHLARHQEADGGFELPPHTNAPPPVFFESR